MSLLTGRAVHLVRLDHQLALAQLLHQLIVFPALHFELVRQLGLRLGLDRVQHGIVEDRRGRWPLRRVRMGHALWVLEDSQYWFGSANICWRAIYFEIELSSTIRDQYNCDK